MIWNFFEFILFLEIHRIDIISNYFTQIQLQEATAFLPLSGLLSQIIDQSKAYVFMTKRKMRFCLMQNKNAYWKNYAVDAFL